MKFFSTAREMEERTKDYYLDLAEKCAANEGLKNILNMLAKDHEQHMKKFQQMEDDECTNLEKTEAYEKTIEVFRNLQKKKETFSCDIDQVKMYQQARDLVEQKLAFYEKGKAEIECEKNKAVLALIIDEEWRHKYVLDNIIEMISRPQYWIEDAEFYHTETY